MLYVVLIMGVFNSLFKDDTQMYSYFDTQIQLSIDNFENEYNYYIEKHTFNGESSEEITSKINRYLNSTLKDKGEFIVDYSLEVGLDPYLAAAVMLQETGCYWTCSKLVTSCNNVGGNKGKPSCNGGSYRKFDTIEDGIRFAINKLNSYYQKGYTKPSQINPYYASDKTWYQKVENYINKLKK